MLLALLDVEEVSALRWRGQRRPGGVGRIFGGQVIAQALAAAQRSLTDQRLVHSLHAYFLRGGDEDHPIDFRVEADMDGGSFSNRRVIASQNDKPLPNLMASFQRIEEGLHHQAAMPQIPFPDILPDNYQFIQSFTPPLPPP